jgi:hypothetical protein
MLGPAVGLSIFQLDAGIFTWEAPGELSPVKRPEQCQPNDQQAENF